MVLPQEQQHYTYADYLALPEDVRAELIDGAFHMMSAPSDVHQLVSGELHQQLAACLRGKKCRAFYAPFDVRLFEREGDCPSDVDIVVEPDLMVICDPKQVDKNGCHGAPDFIIEILSPSNRRHDMITKFQLYQQAGVKEYWIVDPETPMVYDCILQDGTYQVSFVSGDQKRKVHVLDDCTIDLAQVFDNAKWE